MTVISVYAVFANVEEAERIGRQVVGERLAACINILPAVRSIYRWKGAVEESTEAAAILKTSDERADALITRIAAISFRKASTNASWSTGWWRTWLLKSQ